MANIVTEKENKIKEMMSMMGLKMNLYWLVVYLFDYILYLGVIFFLIIAGFLFRIRFFTINSFGSYFFLFIIWGHDLIAISFLISLFFNNRRTALVAGYFLMLGITLVCNTLVESLLNDVVHAVPKNRSGLSVIPFFALYRGLMYLNIEVSFKGSGLT